MSINCQLLFVVNWTTIPQSRLNRDGQETAFDPLM